MTMTTEHPDFPIEDWQYEVRNGDTYLGYAEWVAHRIDDFRLSQVLERQGVETL